jgi:hypothetical protein
MESALKNNPATKDTSDQMPSWREVFLYFFTLGFINIGGPVAQITMMYNHMVERRHWLSDDRFVRIMAFCHMLPGPEALQLAIYVGYLYRAGRVNNDRAELAVCYLQRRAASQQRSLCFETSGPGHHRGRHSQTRSCIDPKLFSCSSSNSDICRN